MTPSDTPTLRFARGAILAYLAEAPTTEIGDRIRVRVKPVVKAHPGVPMHLWSAALRSLEREGVLSRRKRKTREPANAWIGRKRKWRYALTAIGEAMVAQVKRAMMCAIEEARAQL